MSNITGALNSTQVEALANQPVLMFKAFAAILVIGVIAGIGYAIWQMFN
jgi:hypothetical protein